MKYSRFEQLVLVVGGTAILGSVAYSLSSGVGDIVEIIAQALLFAVLLASVHFGRRGGFLAALIASALYVLVRLPALSQGELTVDLLTTVGVRLLSYGFLGIVGGEACMRLRYTMTRLEGQSALDDWSRVYNQPFLHMRLMQACSRNDRYGEPFSIVVIALSPSLFSGFRPSRQRTVVRGLANYVRADVRMVDEVGRLSDGRFVVILPHTPKEGGRVVRDRLVSGALTTLGAQAEAVSAYSLAMPEDADEMRGFVADIAPAPDASPQTSYSFSGGMTENPAEMSTSSAPSSSTLNTSTAVSAQASTKQ